MPPRLLLASLLMLVTAPTPAQDPHAEQLVRSVQRQLVEKGFAPGWPDGHWNPHTEAALADFQRTAGLPPTGTPDPATLSALFAPAEIERTRGVEALPPPTRLPVQSFGLGAAIGFLAATVLALIVFVRRPQSAE